MKKKYVIILVSIFIIGFGVNKLFFDNSSSVEENIKEVEEVPKNLLSMMLETKATSGEYEMTTRSSWPTMKDGYLFNSTLSNCENGSKLRWDDENNSVVMQTSVSDKCYVYFDKLVPPVVVDVEVNQTLGSYVPLIKTYVESQYEIETYNYTLKSSSSSEYNIISNLPYIWLGYGKKDTSIFDDYELSKIYLYDSSLGTSGIYDIFVYVKDIYNQISDTYETSENLKLCFVAGTKVQTSNGLVNIEDIKIGDYVYTINENTKEKELKQVINTITSSSKITYEITADATVVEPSPRHPFYVMDKGWIRAYNLKEEDMVLTTHGFVEIESIKVRYHEKNITTYNLTIEDNHNFLITDNEFLVHNAGSLSSTGS